VWQCEKLPLVFWVGTSSCEKMAKPVEYKNQPWWIADGWDIRANVKAKDAQKAEATTILQKFTSVKTYFASGSSNKATAAQFLKFSNSKQAVIVNYKKLNVSNSWAYLELDSEFEIDSFVGNSSLLCPFCWSLVGMFFCFFVFLLQL
jgi:hypothetical protein